MIVLYTDCLNMISNSHLLLSLLLSLWLLLLITIPEIYFNYLYTIKFPRYQAPMALGPTCPRSIQVVPGFRTKRPSNGNWAWISLHPSTHITTSTTALCLLRTVSLKLIATWCQLPEGSMPLIEVSEIVRLVLSSGRVSLKMSLSEDIIHINNSLMIFGNYYITKQIKIIQIIQKKIYSFVF